MNDITTKIVQIIVGEIIEFGTVLRWVCYWMIIQGFINLALLKRGYPSIEVFYKRFWRYKVKKHKKPGIPKKEETDE